MVEIFNHHFADSVETITRCFPPAYTNVCPVTTVEPVFRIRPVSDSDVMRTIRSLKSSRAKDKYGMDVVMLKESSLTLIKSSHLYLFSAFNNTDCVKALNNIKLEDRVSAMYNNKIKHSIFSSVHFQASHYLIQRCHCLAQGCQTQFLEGCSPAEFCSNPAPLLFK